MLYHHDLLLRIPIFFGVGFIVVWLLRRVVEPAPNGRSAASSRSIANNFAYIYILFVLVAALVLAALFGLDSAFDYFGIREAALIVGGAAGWWFARAEDGRDKAVFVAAIALFMAVIAIEYDTKLFERMTKFNAGSVSVELGNPQQAPAAEPKLQFVTDPNGAQGAFPRTNRIDFAVGQLASAGQSVLRDEQYAQALGGKEPLPAFDQSLVSGMAGDVRAFAIYACVKIERVAAEIGALQSFHRSETTALSIDPRLVGLLRQAFYRVQQPTAEPRGNPEGPDGSSALCPNGPSGQQTLGCAFQAAGDWIGQEFKALPQSGQERGKDFRTAECSKITGPPDASALERPPGDLDSNYLAYFALTTAMAEAAIGNDESAIHLLDRQAEEQHRIVALRKAELDSDKSRLASGACSESVPDDIREQCRSTIHGASIGFLRALMAAIRLETTENWMALQDPSDVLGVSLLERMRTTANDLELAMNTYDGDPTPLLLYRKHMVVANPGERIGRCFDQKKNALKRNDMSRLLVKLTQVDIAMRNNALDIVGQRPQLLQEGHHREEYKEWLDKNAEYVSEFDYDCAREAGLVFSDRVPAWTQQTVAKYWEVEADKFGAPDGITTESPFSNAADEATIGLFCKAKVAYRKAAELLSVAREKDNATTPRGSLDDEIKEETEEQFALSLTTGIYRINENLQKFPLGEIPDNCKWD